MSLRSTAEAMAIGRCFTVVDFVVDWSLKRRPMDDEDYHIALFLEGKPSTALQHPPYTHMWEQPDYASTKIPLHSGMGPYRAERKGVSLFPPVFSLQRCQQRLGFLEIGGVKPLGEPAVHWGQQGVGGSALALVLP